MEETYNAKFDYNSIREEIESLAKKDIPIIYIKDKTNKDKRRFIKIYYRQLNFMIYESTIDKKYINFFILLVNLNAKFIEADTNLIKLQIKQISENMGYSIEHTYKTLKVLKKLNLIDFYVLGKSKYVVINPKYYAKFYNIRYMYSLEYAFESDKISVSDLIGQITICKDIKLDKKNKEVEIEVKQYMNSNFYKEE